MTNDVVILIIILGVLALIAVDEKFFGCALPPSVPAL